MARRRNKSLLQNTKRGITSLFVCSVVLLPLITLSNIPKDFIHRDPRKVITMPAFKTRTADASTSAIKPFKEPIITVTFDDGWESIYTIALPLLQKYGIYSTQYLLSGTKKISTYMSDKQIADLQKNGHEIACHTIDHPDLVILSSKDVANQLNGCKKRFPSATDFASPYGSYNGNTISAIKKVYRSHRNTNGDITNGVNESDINLAANFDPYNIIGFTVRRNTTTAELKQAIDYTVAHNGWLVLTYHEINEESSPFGLDSDTLSEQLSFISHAPARIATIGQVIDARGVQQ